MLERRDADDQVVRPAGEDERVLVDHARRVLVFVDDRVRRRRSRVLAKHVAHLERAPGIGLCQLGETDRDLHGSLRPPGGPGRVPDVVVFATVDDEPRVDETRKELAVRQIAAGSESTARCAPDGWHDRDARQPVGYPEADDTTGAPFGRLWQGAGQAEPGKAALPHPQCGLGAWTGFAADPAPPWLRPHLPAMRRALETA